MVRKLLARFACRCVVEIGQNDDIGMIGKGVDPLHCTLDRVLAMHLGIEEAAQHAPDIFLRFKRLTSSPIFGQRMRIGEAVARPGLEIVDTFVSASQSRNGDNHMQQHFIAIGNEQRAAHAGKPFRCAAATSSSGHVAKRIGGEIRSGS